MIEFFGENLIYNASLTPTTENAQFPVENIQKDFRTKVWRSTSNSDNLVLDLGSTEDIDAVCVSPSWQDGFGFSTMTIEANATNDFSSPAFSTTLTFSEQFEIGIKEFSSTQSYRFWRFVFTSTLGYVELANVYIGKKIGIDTNGITYNWRYQNEDLTEEEENIYGQDFIDDYGTRKEIRNLKYEVMNVSEIEKFFTFYDAVRTTRPFWMKFCDTNTTIPDSDRISGIYKLRREPSVVNISSGFYSVGIDLREQK